jgi:hypothetical protein
MIAYITSINEPTTDLCIWSLTRLGFSTRLILGRRSLWSKLQTIYEQANDDFIRVDADVVVNKNVLQLITLKEAWWYQAMTFDWYKQDVTHGGIQFVRKEAIEIIKAGIPKAMKHERPETYLSRLEGLHSPRRFETFDMICGLHGYKQKDYERVEEIKRGRNQYKNYDFELAKALDKL